MTPLFSAKGLNGILSVYEYKITISRKGVRNLLHGMRGDRDILMNNISALKLRRGNLFRRGYLHFTFVENIPQSSNIKLIDDRNTILFSRKNNEDFIRAKELIEEKMYELD